MIKPAYAALRAETTCEDPLRPDRAAARLRGLILLAGAALCSRAVPYDGRRGVPQPCDRRRPRRSSSLEAKDLSLGAEPDTRYFPRVSFVPEGATVAVEAQTLTDVPSPPPRVGDPIEVAYDPEHPGHVDVLATEGAAEGAGRTFFLLGSLVPLVALGVAAAWLVLVLVVWTS